MMKKRFKRSILHRVICNSIQLMQTKAENLLNPYRHHLSAEAKKRLRWLYILYEESKNNVSRAADKIGISRQWLSVIKNTFERNNRDPRSLDPDSRAPHDHAGGRRRIAKEVEDKIIEIRDNMVGAKGKYQKSCSEITGSGLLRQPLIAISINTGR